MNKFLYENVEHKYASKPICNLYSHNLDFSSFPLLCDIVYREMKCVRPRIMKLLPFCAFMHAMTTCLNAWLFQTVTYINGEDRYCHEEDAVSLIPKHMLIPQPIAEYFAMINTVITPSGETVCVNIPNSCLPRMTVKNYEDDTVPDILPGSFGSATADSHNAYECYVAPYVTRQLVEATRDDTLNPYMPLPEGHFPLNTFPNQNLLGYFDPEQLTAEGLDLLQKYTFPDTNNMAGRLQYVSELMRDVTYLLSHCFCHFNMMRFHNIQRYSEQSILVCTEANPIATNRCNEDYLAPISSPLYSAYAFGETTAAQAILFALRRKRNDLARGLCYTTATGSAPDGWANTINYNFKMMKQFAPQIGINHPYLRFPFHQLEMPIGDRTYAINNWVKTFEETSCSHTIFNL